MEVSATDNQDADEDKMGNYMEEAWKKRSERLTTDIAIDGWICSSDPRVMKDVVDNHLGVYLEAVNRLLEKWYFFEVEYNSERMGKMINRFWQEFEELQSKTEPYSNH
jgi:hypothetical protein